MIVVDDDTILFASGMTQGRGLTDKESGDLAVICDAWYCMWYVDEDGYNEVSQQGIVMEIISSFLCVKRQESRRGYQLHGRI